MILYRSQPKSYDTNNIINLETKRNFVNRILETESKFNDRGLVRDDIISMMSDATVIDGLLCLSAYQTILVVTSFSKHNYPDRMRDTLYRPIKSAGDHMLPIVHAMNESLPEMYVTQADDEFNIPYVTVDDYFRLDNDFKPRKFMKTRFENGEEFEGTKTGKGVVFDAVVLLGCESMLRGKHKAEDIRKKFQPYCTDNFDLIDIYRGDFRKITGKSANIDTIVNKFINVVNTPKKVYDSKSLYDTKQFDIRYVDVVRTKYQLMYERLGKNIKNVNDYFRVYKS
jgi:hypothetical protein